MREFNWEDCTEKAKQSSKAVLITILHKYINLKLFMNLILDSRLQYNLEKEKK